MIDLAETAQQEVAKRFWANPKVVNVVAGLVFFAASCTWAVAGSAVWWNVNNVLTTQDRLTSAIIDINKYLAGAEERAKQRDIRIANLETSDGRQTAAWGDYEKLASTQIGDHEKRLIVLEQKALADHERRLDVLEEPAVTQKLNHRQAVAKR